MLNVKRWNELKSLSEEQIKFLCDELKLDYPPPLGIISIMNAEFRRDEPDKAQAIHEHFFAVKK